MQNLLAFLALIIPSTTALRVGPLEIPMDNSVAVAVMLILSFLTLVALQHLSATSNVAKAVAASKTAQAESKPVPKRTPASKKPRKKTPASKKKLSKSSSLNKVVKVTFEGSFGLRIDSAKLPPWRCNLPAAADSSLLQPLTPQSQQHQHRT